jgi:hypothetical protein
MTNDRERLVALLDALDASQTTLQRDVVRGEGRTGIRGRSRDKAGNDASVIYPDGDGFLLYVTFGERTGDYGVDREPSSLPWKNAKAKLSFCNVTQDGDWEGCLRLSGLPNPKEAEAIREVMSIRKRRIVTDAARSQLEAMREAANTAKRGGHVDLAA